MESKILIIEDDKDIREGIRIILTSEGYSVDEAENGIEGLKKLNSDTDLVILDVIMPGMSGIKTCEEIRKISNVPVLFLTAKSSDSDKLIGLMAGGDDYVTKPFSFSELLGRVKALLRRYMLYRGKANAPVEAPADTFIERSGIKIHEHYNQVWMEGEEIDLTEIEYKILYLLMKYPGKIFSARNIYESVWEEDYLCSSNGTVMVHIRKLRLKIEKYPNEPQHIKTLWGKGYRFE